MDSIRDCTPRPQNPMPCRHCGVIDLPDIRDGAGPHFARAICRHCGNFLTWISQHSPEVREAKRQEARLKAMAAKPVSQVSSGLSPGTRT
jgi:hypothetical protein